MITAAGAPGQSRSPGANAGRAALRLPVGTDDEIDRTTELVAALAG
jgi:hypothetical protein